MGTEQTSLSKEWGQRKKKKSKRSRSRSKEKKVSDKVARHPLTEVGTEKEMDSRKRRHSPGEDRGRGETVEKKKRSGSREGRKRSRSREKRQEDSRGRKTDGRDGKKEGRDEKGD